MSFQSSCTLLCKSPLQSVLLIACIALVGVSCAPRKVSTVDDAGVVRRQGEMQGRRQAGTWTYFDASGAREAAGTWQNDKQIGQWTWWHPNGQIRQRGTYAGMGLRTGWWTFHASDDSLQAAGGYGDGLDGALDRQHGPWTWWRADGSVTASGAFSNASRALAWTTHATAEQPATQGAYFLGHRVGPWHEGDQWIDRGVPADYGVYREPQAGAPKRWGLLRDQRPVGVWTVYRSDGSMLAAAERGERLERMLLYRPDGLPEAWVTWSPDGVRSLTVYAEGQPVADPAAAPPQAEGPLEERLNAAIAALTASLTATVAEALPAEESPAPVPEVLHGVSLSPLAVLPGLWTAAEEASVDALVRAYTRGRTSQPGDYGFSEPPGGDRRLAAGIEGRQLPPVRVLAADGSVLSLVSSDAATAVIVMRGFSGQVCIYCASQTAALVDAMERFRAQKCRVILLYPGSTESVPVFLQAVQTLGRDVPADLTIAIDPDLAFVKAMGIEHMLARPTTLVVNRSGTVNWAYIGRSKEDRPGIEEILTRVEAAP